LHELNGIGILQLNRTIYRIPSFAEGGTLTLPAFNSEGDLPAGVHCATLQEIETRFGTANRSRELLFKRLDRIVAIVRGTQHLVRAVVFGSFVTSEPEPNDIDLFLVFDEAFDASACDSEIQLILDHAAADAHFGASIFWLRRPATFGGEQATIEFWQYRRDRKQRGIIEIVEADQ
jgi:hypothetical protein